MFVNKLAHTVALCAAITSPCLSPSASAADEVRVVYHMVEGLTQAQRAIANIRNHLNADPSVKIVVVGNGEGVMFMIEDAKDRNGNPFEVAIQDLTSKGVEFVVCRNTLTARKIDPARVLPEARIVQSGVAEVARLQAKEAYSYLRP
jgi:intracellular sulfur oxidation DsrE/DsrF family protein